MKGSGSSSYQYHRKYETLVTEINLYYCSAVGLMHVGVLPMPDIYTYHRMVNRKKRARAKIPIVTHKRIRSARTLTVDGTQMSTSEEYNDLFEIPSDDDSDDEDADDGHDD
jgi:hypothetical protein